MRGDLHTDGGSTAVSGRNQRELRYRSDHDESPSVAVVNALAEFTGVDATELTPRLNDSADPDALDAIFADKFDGTSRGGGSVAFPVDRHEVIVHADGDVVVQNRGRRSGD